MRAVTWVARIAIFFFLLIFALKNRHIVVLYSISEHAWHAPLVIYLLTALIVGMGLGLSAMLPTHLRQRQELRQLRLIAALQGPSAQSPILEVELPHATPPHGI
jgi:uncharacterized integral membrane protein